MLLFTRTSICFAITFRTTHFDIIYSYSSVPTEIEMKSFGWTREEDSIIAVMNYLYKDPFGVVIQKALDGYRPFPFQSSVCAPSAPMRQQGLGKALYGLQASQMPSYPHPLRSTKNILDRVMWQQKAPQDEIFTPSAIEANPRFAFHLREFDQLRKEKIKQESSCTRMKVVEEREEKNGCWSWAEREKVHIHLVCKEIVKNEDHSCVIKKEGSDRDEAISSSAYERSDTRDRDGDNGMAWTFFSSGAKSAWSACQVSALPSPRPTSLPLSPTLSDHPPVDLDNFLFAGLAGNGGDPDDIDLGFGFGPDERDDDPFTVDLIPGQNPLTSAITSPVFERGSQRSTWSDANSHKGKLGTERLFSCSTDFHPDWHNPVENSLPRPPYKGMNTIVASVRTAIREVESRKLPPPPLPGVSRFVSHSFFSSTI